MGGAAAVAVLGVALALASCEVTATFTCEEDLQCGAGGTCELDGLCSVADPLCASGRRYAEHSGAQSGECVGGALTVGFAAASSLEDESSGSVQIAVVLSGPHPTQVTVNYRVGSSSTATAVADYTVDAGELVFAPGEVEQSIAVTIVADGVAEADETVVLELVEPSAGSLVRPTHTLTISANLLARLRMAMATSSAAEGTDSAVVIEVVDVNGAPTTSPVDITFDFAITGNATPGVDYSLASGSRTIPAGAATAGLEVDPIDDTLDEDPEDVIITLTSAANAAILAGSEQQTHTILDNDPDPMVGFVVTASMAAETAGTATVTVSLSSVSGRQVIVDHAVTGGSAGGDDFALAAGTLVFAPGETSKGIVVTVMDDVLDEDPETVQLGLSNQTNATIVGAMHLLTIADDDPMPTVQFDPTQSDGTFNEGSGAGSTPFLYRVVLSEPSGRAVSCDVAFSGSAQIPGDYTVPAGNDPVVFQPGETLRTVRLDIIADAVNEPGASESILMTLASPTNATIGAVATRSHTILDDD